MLAHIDDPGPKAYRRGTHRSAAPTETVQRVAAFAPAMGITRIANVTGLDCIGIPVVVVCRPNARSVSVSQGKGLDLDAARASGLMEAVEGYHAEHIVNTIRFAGYDELRFRHKLVDVAELAQTLDTFNSDLPIPWIEGRDLLTDDPVSVPFEIVHMNYTAEYSLGPRSFFASSNGLASGNHPLEAISHGVCEIVERDATARWGALGDTEREDTRLDLATVDDPDCCLILEKFSRAQISLAVWETTSEIGIPSFMCTISDSEADPQRRLYGGTGMGCHPTREIALLRALTEAAQSRLTMITGSRDDVSRAEYERLRSPAAHAGTRLIIGSGRPVRTFAGAPSWQAESFAEDVAWELGRLRSFGIGHVIVVDLSRPEFEVPVVRVVIPGLQDVAAAGPAGEQLRAVGRRLAAND